MFFSFAVYSIDGHSQAKNARIPGVVAFLN
jgi:hypothetical protein